MNFSDLFLTMAQTTEIEQTSMFPFPLSLHLIFCCVSLLFFVYRFIKEKSPYQIIMAVAIPFSLVIWLASSKSLFYTVGIIEAILLVVALVTYIIGEKKKNNKKASENAENIQQQNQSEGE